jgi:ribonuclease VapC
MIVDSSAVVAMVREEPGHDDLLTALDRSVTRPMISAVSYVESAIVLDAQRDPVLSGRLDQLLDVFQVEVVPVTTSQARRAREAYRDFGRGSGHLAKLNFGDVFAYALAAETGEPLLYKGDDFGHTDVRSAV